MKTPPWAIQKQRFTLKTKMTVAITLLTAVLLIATAFFFIDTFQQKFKDSISQQNFTLVSTLAHEFDSKFMATQQHLVGLAKMVSPEKLATSATAEEFLLRQADNRTLFDNGLFLYTPTFDTLAAATEKGYFEPEFEDRPYETSLVNTVETRRPQISEPFFSTGENPRPVIMFTAPVFTPDGQIVAILAGNVDLLANNFLGHLVDIRLGVGGYLYLYNHERTLIAHPDRSRVLQRDVPLGANKMFDQALEGFEGTGETVNSRGLHALSSFKRLQTNDWILAANFPLVEAYSPLQQAGEIFLLILLVMLFVATVVTWFLMNYLTTPLGDLARQIEDFSTSGRVKPLQIKTRDEIGILAVTFNQMVSTLAEKKQALEEQKHFSEQMLQGAAVAAFVIDANHKVIVWNHACEQLTGIRAEEMLGTRNHWRAFYDDQRPCLADFIIDDSPENLQNFYDNPRPADLTPDALVAESWLELSGKLRYIAFNAAPIRNETGELVAVIETLEDFTERKKIADDLSASHSLLGATLESTGDGLLVVDLQGQISVFNHRFGEMFQFPEGLLQIGNDAPVLSQVLTKMEAPDAFLAKVQELYDHPEMECADVVRLKSGEIFERISRPQLLDGLIVGRVWSFRDITVQRRVLEQMNKLSVVVEQSPNLVVITDPIGRIEYVNSRFTEITGYTSEEILGENPRILKSGNIPDEYYRTLWETITAGQNWRGEFHNKKKNGQLYWEEAVVSPLKNAEGVITNFVAVMNDISQQKTDEQRQLLTDQVLKILSLPDTQTDKLQDLLQLVKDFTRMEGVALLLPQRGDLNYQHTLGPVELFASCRGHFSTKATGGDGMVETLCGKVFQGLTSGFPAHTLSPGGSFSTNNGLDPETGLCSHVHGYHTGVQTMALIALRSGKKTVGLLQFIDRQPDKLDSATIEFLEKLAASIGIALESQKTGILLQEKEEHLNFLTNYDTLTKLPNRDLFGDRLQHVINKLKRTGAKIALLLIDLDRFKTINDSLGHDFGDSVICQIAARLKTQVRVSDTLARYGGDAFALILEDEADLKNILNKGQQILAQISEAISCEEHQIYLTASVGISIYPNDGNSIESLINCAEIAMYRAKEQGRNNCQFYRPEMNTRSRELFFLEGSLRQGLEQDQFVLFYQPQIHLKSGRVSGAEALIRWIHPSLGMVSPADFIPLAEETGLIIPLGEWVLRTACQKIKAWNVPGRAPVRVSVNISGRQFRDPDFITKVDQILEETGIDPSHLEIEITESVVMGKVDESIMTLTDLKSRGIDLAIDDFGTGYSSLSYLQKFPITHLKIDRSFVMDVCSNQQSAAIASSIIALSRKMGLQVIAEGVETEQQLEFLKSEDCDEVQGYFFSRPVPADEFEKSFLQVAGDSLTLE